MLGYDDSVGFGDVRDGVFGEVSEPFVLGQWIEQDAFLDFAQKVDAVKDVAQEIVDLNAHGRVEIVQVGRSQHLLRISDLNAQRRQLLVREMAGRCRGAPDNDEKMIIRKTRRERPRRYGIENKKKEVRDERKKTSRKRAKEKEKRRIKPSQHKWNGSTQ